MEHITIGLEQITKVGVRGMLIHDLRIPKFVVPGTRMRPYANYVREANVRDNIIYRTTSAREMADEFDRRLHLRNLAVAGRNRARRAMRAAGRAKSMAKAELDKKVGKYERELSKRNIKNRAFSGVIGLTDAALAKLDTTTELGRQEVNDLFRDSLSKVAEELGLTMEDVSHAVIHWDESKPHLHFGLHYIDSRGKTFSKRLGPAQLSKMVQNVNKRTEGMTQPIPYAVRRKNGEKIDTHKTTKVLKQESFVMAHANQILRDGLQRVTVDLKKMTDLKKRKAEQVAAYDKTIADKFKATKAALRKQKADFEKQAELNKQLKSVNRFLKNQIKDDLQKIEIVKMELVANQHDLDKEKESFARLKQDARAYQVLKKQVLVVLNLIKILPIIQKEIQKKSKLGSAISDLESMLGMPKKEDPEMGS